MSNEAPQRLLVAFGVAAVGIAIIVVAMRITPRGHRFDFGPGRLIGVGGLLLLLAVLFVADAVTSP